MGRPSKLTPTQWEEMGRRLAGGEAAAALGREFGVSETTISKRFAQFPKNEVAELGKRLAALPPAAQAAAVTLGDQMRAISNNLAAGSNFGAATSKRLHELAHRAVQQMPDDADLGEHVETLKGVAAFTRTANEAAANGLALLNANKTKDDTGRAPVPLAIVGDDLDG
jgi:hypothetical protein